MDLRSMSPSNSGSALRDAAGLVTLWSWIGASVVLDGARSIIDRVAASTLSRVIGSEPIDPGGLSSWREVVSS